MPNLCFFLLRIKFKLTVSINSMIFENQKSHATLTIFESQDEG